MTKLSSRYRGSLAGSVFALLLGVSSVLLAFFAFAFYSGGTVLAQKPGQDQDTSAGPTLATMTGPASQDQDLRMLPYVAPNHELEAQRLTRHPRPETGGPAGSQTSAFTYFSSFINQVLQAPTMPSPLLTFEGLNNTCGCAPPDSVGDVGPNHYVEAVNESFKIFDKSGNTLAGPTTYNSFFAPLAGTPCANQNQGDPFVLYDQMADRWLISDFAFPSFPGSSFWECIGVSKTPDPVAGGWFLYAVQVDSANPTFLGEQPKFGLWPDAYYLTMNMFSSPTMFTGVRVYALDRASMIGGGPTHAIGFTLTVAGVGNSYLFVPASFRAGDPPPAGRQEFVLAIDSPGSGGVTLTQVHGRLFHVDFAVPANSTFGVDPTHQPNAEITVNGFVDAFTDSAGGSLVPQQGTAIRLDTEGDHIMTPVVYQNRNGTESLWAGHTVMENYPNGPTAVRWYQFDVTGGTFPAAPVQQQSWDNGGDGLFRWMPSIAVDQNGNAAIGYSTSSASIFPSIRYAGRRVGDPLNNLGQGEAIMTNGGGSQTSGRRWGDYSMLTIDPADNLSFWHVNEYYPATGASWSTRIGKFKFPPRLVLIVTTLDDHDDGVCDAGDCTLREAITAINAGASATIRFTSGVTGTIQLASALPTLNGNIIIEGPGADLLTVRRNTGGSYSIFNVNAGITATISGLTISNGLASSGGGISCAGMLSLFEVAVTGNTATNGGGLFSNFGKITISNSTISGNTVSSNIVAGSGGGIFNSGGTLVIKNSTISGNSAIGPGGNKDSGGGIITNVGTVTLTNTTISGNSGDLGGGFRNVNGGTVHSGNTLIALNTSPSGPDINGSFISDGHNLIGNGTVGTGFTNGVNGDQVGVVDPKLDAVLKNNGGPTNTHALLSGSTAINAGDNALAPLTDQRGYFRSGISDIGAFEFNGVAPIPPAVTTGAATNVTTATATLNAAVNPNGLSTSFQFTSDFGAFPVQDAGSGTGNVPFSMNVTGLSPNTQYHFNATATNAAGSVQGIQQIFTTQSVPTPTPTPTPAMPTVLANISTRLRVETGDNALIGGFIITGTQGKKVIIRAIGPSLPFAGVLADPTLELYQGSTLLEENDNWVDSPNKQAIIDSTIPPSNNLESGIARTLLANNTGYTAIVRGANNGTGIGVVEAYDLDRTVDSKLANISTRGLVQTGDNVLIAGTIILGQATQKVIIRAIGPSLSLPGKLADPTLQLVDGNGVVLEENDDWVDSPNKQAIIDSTIPPSNDKESAIVRTLSANGAQYTAIVRGVNDTTGIAVVEVYALP